MVATANKNGSDIFGLVEGKEYVLEKTNLCSDMWLVYDKGTYITASETDCFHYGVNENYTGTQSRKAAW